MTASFAKGTPVHPINRILGAAGIQAVRSDAVDELEAYRFARMSAPNFVQIVSRLLILEKGEVTFIQVGANDGYRDDEFRHQIEGNFLRGLMIEPQPRPFARLKKRYGDNPRVSLEQCAISHESGTLPFYAFTDAVEGTAQLDVFSSFDRSIVERVKQANDFKSAIEAFMVPTLPLHAAAAKYGLENVDLLVIDTEGFDFEIVKMIDFRRMQPSLIQFEHLNLSAADLKAAMRYLTDKGYGVTLYKGEVIAIHPSVGLS